MYLRPEYLREDAAALADDGYEVVQIDGSGWTSEADVHASISQSLQFPDYYGRNFHALNDCLGDVATHEYGTNPSAKGTVIVIDEAGSFAAASPGVFAAIVEAFAGTIVYAMKFGHRMLVMLKVDDPNLKIPLQGERTRWNHREWLDSKRILPA
ncbi:Barnase inhibitor [Aeromicrobium sp. 9AM]|nr:Barnase inhibitor [Aeromicrobium sp. 9AM]